MDKKSSKASYCPPYSESTLVKKLKNYVTCLLRWTTGVHSFSQSFRGNNNIDSRLSAFHSVLYCLVLNKQLIGSPLSLCHGPLTCTLALPKLHALKCNEDKLDLGTIATK